MKNQSRDSLLKLIGSQVRQCRKAAGLSQADLAEKAGISLDMVGRLERGITAPSLDTLNTLSTTFGVSIAELVSIGISESALLRRRNKELEDIVTMLNGVDSKDLKWLKTILQAVLRK